MSVFAVTLQSLSRTHACAVVVVFSLLTQAAERFSCCKYDGAYRDAGAFLCDTLMLVLLK